MKKVIRHIQEKIRLQTSSHRPLPDFLIIGAQKCGTTSLYEYLRQHPSLRPNVTAKEIHFFDANWNKGIDWYRSNFPIRKNNTYYYEASPSYLLHPHAPSRAASVIPDAKLIIVLRNPVDRAYSGYQHQVRAGRETLSFEDAISHESDRICDELNKMKHNPEYESRVFRLYSYLERGKYIEQIYNWANHYKKENILILESESLWENPQETFDQIFNFLGIAIKEIKTRKKHNTGNYTTAMPARVRQELQQYYSPYNDKLFEYIGREFKWSD